MGIYIKGMEMPNCCEQCFLVSECKRRHYEVFTVDGGYITRLVKDDCPLTEVPEPHGKLIDADKLYATVQSNESADAYVRFLLRHSPTVREAESEAPATEPEADKDPRGECQ